MASAVGYHNEVAYASSLVLLVRLLRIHSVERSLHGTRSRDLQNVIRLYYNVNRRPHRTVTN
jgi:hypothetical protein